MSTGDKAPLVEVRDLHKEYLLPRDSLLAPPRRVHAVRGVSFELRAGCNLGWSANPDAASPPGPRGDGARDTDPRPRAGARHRRHDVDDPRRRHLRRNFQMVFQDPFGSLDPRQKVARIVAEPLALERPSREESRERIIEVLEAVGLKRPTPTSTRTSSLEGNASGSPSRGRSSRGRPSSSPTNRCRRWTSRCRRRC